MSKSASSSQVKFIRTPRTIKVTKAWKGSKYEPFPVTVTQLDGTTYTIEHKPKKAKSVKAKSVKVRKIKGVRVDSESRKSQEWAIVGKYKGEVESYL